MSSTTTAAFPVSPTGENIAERHPNEADAGRDSRPREPEIYPKVEPYAHGMLDVGGGNHVYWEQCGNPDGKPAT
ncbi:MAG: hypothetical protein ACRDSK_23475 [Actinophytocola sp.]|uniref:hypothetical protein n=1 Tax=Actinophytocola sp. TaxID=1872138 RepID=UPI003D6ABB7E